MIRANGPKLLVAGATAVVVAAVIAAIVVLGSPPQQRQRRLDERRVRDLSAIASAIGQYAGSHGALPPDLSALGKEPGPRPAPVDPGSGAAYEYQVIGTGSYRLCAVFAARSSAAANQRFIDLEGWTHDSGRQCFERRQALGKN